MKAVLYIVILEYSLYSKLSCCIRFIHVRPLAALNLLLATPNISPIVHRERVCIFIEAHVCVSRGCSVVGRQGR